METKIKDVNTNEVSNTKEAKAKRIAIGYTVSALTGSIERLKTAKLITTDEEKVLIELTEKIGLRYVLKRTV